jgi:hypothetical protein
MRGGNGHPRACTHAWHVSIMTKALVVKRSKATGVVPAAASFAVPGVGQLINGQSTKALGVFGVAMATGAAFLTGLPLLGGLIGAAHVVTHVYAVGDAYVQARKKR